MSKKEQGLIYTVIFTFIVCFVFAFGLVFVNQQTSAMVMENRLIANQMAVLNALAVPYTGRDQVQDAYKDVLVEQHAGVELFKFTAESQINYAKRFIGSGLWGRIEGVLAVSEDLERIIGIEIITHNETPGLGGRIDESWFKEQLRNEKIIDGAVTVGIAGTGDPDKENGSIHAITGASRTSSAINSILRDELAQFEILLGDRS